MEVVAGERWFALNSSRLRRSERKAYWWHRYYAFLSSQTVCVFYPVSKREGLWYDE
ncbi:unnamed protein product [Sphenostylis stenocarpa]|uniref:Uncharacterized protein n=1 Tax=Sphenostylis stenocarpa TaxID=92480 RepID=A0AA86RRA7_9FABA|nr:unnamed protein product [Sphenostylis stenocarpa]